MATPSDLFRDGLREAYGAARKLEKAMTALAEAVRNDKLRSRLFGHRDTTRRQIERLEEAFEAVEMKPRAKVSKVADALVREAPKDGDLAIVLHAIKIEHAELAMYSGLTKLAEEEGLRRPKSLLEKSGKETESEMSELEAMIGELEEGSSRAAS